MNLHYSACLRPEIYQKLLQELDSVSSANSTYFSREHCISAVFCREWGTKSELYDHVNVKPHPVNAHGTRTGIMVAECRTIGRSRMVDKAPTEKVVCRVLQMAWDSNMCAVKIYSADKKNVIIET